MRLEGLTDVLTLQIKDLYSAEAQFRTAREKLSVRAGCKPLRELLQHHVSSSEQQLVRLNKIADYLGISAKGHKCYGAEGLVKECNEIVRFDGDESSRDSALAGAAQRIAHYEVASYSNALSLAQLLGYDDVVELLSDSLSDETTASKALKDMAESTINPMAFREERRANIEERRSAVAAVPFE
ncbi:MAG: DUF892 family protein [Bdellovibrionota bacterium]